MPGKVLQTAVLLLAVSAASCMISEQTGQLVPDGNPRYWDQKLGDVRFDFDSPYNKGVVYGRSLALALLAFWIFRAEKGGQRMLSLVLGLPLLLAAAFLLYRDLPTLRAYRIEATAGGLVLEIPPDVMREVRWNGVHSLTVSGWEMRRTSEDPRGKNPFADVPEWETMDLTLEGEETVRVDLRRLSWEQRQSVWKAIVVRAGLAPRGR